MYHDSLWFVLHDPELIIECPVRSHLDGFYIIGGQATNCIDRAFFPQNNEPRSSSSTHPVHLPTSLLT